MTVKKTVIEKKKKKPEVEPMLNISDYTEECKETETVKAAFRAWIFFNKKISRLKRMPISNWNDLLEKFKITKM